MIPWYSLHCSYLQTHFVRFIELHILLGNLKVLTTHVEKERSWHNFLPWNISTKMIQRLKEFWDSDTGSWACFGSWGHPPYTWMGLAHPPSTKQSILYLLLQRLKTTRKYTVESPWTAKQDFTLSITYHGQILHACTSCMYWDHPKIRSTTVERLSAYVAWYTPEISR